MTPIEFLEEQGIDYEPLTTGWLRIQCVNPSHPDNNPSMGIHSETGSFNCFGCGSHGNFKQFVNLVTGKSWEDSGYQLKKNNPGTRIIREDPTIIQMGSVRDPRKEPKVREWLRNYGVLEDSFIQDYGILYSVYSEAISKHLLTREDEKLNWSKFENRILTPMTKLGKIVNIEARTLLSEEERGEIPKVLYVKGGDSSYLYNWDKVDIYKPIILTESIKNFCKIWNVNKNVVAMYHAIPGQAQVELLKKNRAGILVFCDSDSAGLGTMGEDGQWVKTRKGTIQYLSEKLGQDFKMCFDSRKHENGKEYDANDCSLREIENHLRGAYLYSEYEKRMREKLGVVVEEVTSSNFGLSLPRKKIKKA